MTSYHRPALATCAAMLSISAHAAARFDVTEITIAETRRAIVEHRGTLIKFAYAYIQATKHRHPPSLFPPLN